MNFEISGMLCMIRGRVVIVQRFGPLSPSTTTVCETCVRLYKYSRTHDSMAKHLHKHFAALAGTVGIVATTGTVWAPLSLALCRRQILRPSNTGTKTSEVYSSSSLGHFL